jgi:hypothetical protein
MISAQAWQWTSNEGTYYNICIEYILHVIGYVEALGIRPGYTRGVLKYGNCVVLLLEL